VTIRSGAATDVESQRAEDITARAGKGGERQPSYRGTLRQAEHQERESERESEFGDPRTGYAVSASSSSSYCGRAALSLKLIIPTPSHLTQQSSRIHLLAHPPPRLGL
jgi:hypothetical protein